jgi:hypothetical protein
MSWRDLLQKPGEKAILPWFGGRSLRSGDRIWDIEGRLPRESSWYEWDIVGNKVTLAKRADSREESLESLVHGYLIGDRLVVDGTNVNPEPSKIAEQSEPVLLIEPGLDRFARVVAGRIYENGELIFLRQDFPLGPEDAVLAAYRRQAVSVQDIKDVTPALDAAFRMESWQRVEIVRRRAEAERLRAEEEAHREQMERRAVLAQALGTGVGRRQMAQVDFPQAARAALAAGGALFVDHRPSHVRGEMVIVFQIDRRQFECVCDMQFRIIDSGICLQGHGTGIKYDDRLTMESLPGVIRQAIREGKLVVFRHVGGGDDRDDYEDD